MGNYLNMGNLTKFLWLIPAIYGGYKAATASNKNERLLYGSIAGAGLIAFVSAKGSTTITDPTADYPDTPLPPGQSIDTELVNVMVGRLKQVLSEWLLDASSRCSAFEVYYNMPDAEFIAVANAYKNAYSRTIRQDMARTWQSGCSIFFTQWDDRVLSRMNELNIP